MSKVFLINANKQPLDPIYPGYARKLLTWGKAAVFRRFPFTLILKEDRAVTEPQPLRVKIDPGSRTTGIALVNDTTGEVVFAAELTHRGQQIRDALLSRRQIRRNRRNRKTRYRPARFLNRRRETGWLPPSLVSRIANTVTWVKRLMSLAPIGAISQELVRFDTQLMQNSEISGIEYQQGELAGYEVREYLLEKWGRKCAYCGATNVPLQVEHIIPRARGGTNRVSNLTLACEPCNLSKGTRTAAEFGHSNVQARAKAPLKDAAAVNQTRWALYRALAATGLPVETGSGGLTKYNRIRQGLAKSHWTDAACVGASTPGVLIMTQPVVKPLLIRATGHGNRQMCGINKYGFPVRHRTRHKSFKGFRTGDIVQALIPTGKNAGRHFGRVAIRQRPCFTLNGFDVHPKYLTVLHKSDGYTYAHSKPNLPVARLTPNMV
jgi:5-methylcytosine-specific restriction endonuclease McrA